MKTTSFGSTDLKVTNLCLGTMQFGWTADEAASVSVLDGYVGAGGNFIDTADIYSRWAPGNPGGVSEEIVGRWMKERGNRGDLVVATKLRGQMWEGPDGEGLGRAHIERAVEDSLRRLQIETIDLYQTHWPDDDTPLEETLTVFVELVTAGRVRSVSAPRTPRSWPGSTRSTSWLRPGENVWWSPAHHHDADAPPPRHPWAFQNAGSP